MKTIRSRSRRDQMSKARSPRESCSTTIGTRGISSALQPAQDGVAGEAPLAAELAPGQLAAVGHLPDGLLVDAQQLGDLGDGQDLARVRGDERVLPDRHRVV